MSAVCVEQSHLSPGYLYFVRLHLVLRNVRNLLFNSKQNQNQVMVGSFAELQLSATMKQI